MSSPIASRRGRRPIRASRPNPGPGASLREVCLLGGIGRTAETTAAVIRHSGRVYRVAPAETTSAAGPRRYVHLVAIDPASGGLAP